MALMLYLYFYKCKKHIHRFDLLNTALQQITDVRGYSLSTGSKMNYIYFRTRTLSPPLPLYLQLRKAVTQERKVIRKLPVFTMTIAHSSSNSF